MNHYVYKITDKRRQADIYFIPPQVGDETEDPILLDEWDFLEPANYPFDTEAPAMFHFDINMEDFLIHISKLNSIQARKQAPIIIGEMLKGENEGKKYLTTGRYGKKYGNVTSKTVREWAKEGKVEYYTIPGRGKGDEYRILDTAPTNWDTHDKIE